MKEQYYYSATRRGFYPGSMKESYEKSINGWPEDAVEISEVKYNALLKGQEKGKEITPDINGKPVLTDPVIDPVVVAEGTQSSLLKEAEDIICYLERAVKYGMATEEDKLRLEAWEKYSVLLYRVNPENPEWPEKPE